MTYFFDKYPEFVDSDVRKIRKSTTVSAESLHKRCAVLIPQWLVEGKTILDLGHCIGAFGQWALANGAKHYTGVEMQKSFCVKSEELLSKYWSEDKFTIINSDIKRYLQNTHEKYDIIIASGILHGYIDVVSILKEITNAATEHVIIETLDVAEYDSPAISFRTHNMTSKFPLYPYSGWTALVGYNALQVIMNEFDFAVQGERLYPEKITETHDAYNDDLTAIKEGSNSPQRYMVRYVRKNTIKRSLEHKIKHNQLRTENTAVKIENWTVIKPDIWKFDDEVAKRFQKEAEDNIPDYERVIQLCLELANSKVNKESTIVDIGSALGHTMDKFLADGYTNVIGIESSQSMIDNSKHKEKVILSDVYPENLNSDFVMANWTLHFIVERKKYIQDVYNSLSDGGVFIISDKTAQTKEIKDLYYNFKRANGITDEYIYEKEKKLQGYMHPYAVEWYMDNLKEIGFNNIQILNSRYGFVTFYCEK